MGPARLPTRPSEYAPQVIDMECNPIREVGMSDSAAAESTGMSSSTISRWKQKYPEIVPRLQEARQECRMRHLRNIERLADSDKPAVSLRASIWILERVFPEDYAPKASERQAHRESREWLRAREAEEFRKEQREEQRRADLARDRAAAEAKQNAAAAEAAHPVAGTTPEAEDRASASVTDSHNS